MQGVARIGVEGVLSRDEFSAILERSLREGLANTTGGFVSSHIGVLAKTDEIDGVRVRKSRMQRLGLPKRRSGEAIPRQVRLALWSERSSARSTAIRRKRRESSTPIVRTSRRS